MDKELKESIEKIQSMDFEEKVKTITEIKEMLKKISPFANEPVDFVQWVKEELVIANDYNPNTVAPPRNGVITYLHTGGWLHTAYCSISA